MSFLMEGPLKKAPKCKPRANNHYTMGLGTKQRWFTLDRAANLTYFENSSKRDRKDSVTVKSVRMLSRNESDSGRAFLAESVNGHIVLMEAATPELARKWVQALETAVAGQRRGPVPAPREEDTEDLKKELGELQAELAAAKSEHDKHVAQLEAKHDAEIKAVRDEGNAMLEKLNDTESELEQSRNQEAELRAELDSVQQQVDEAVETSKNAAEELLSQHAQTEQLEQKLTNSQTEVADLKSQLAEQKIVNDQLYQKLVDVREQMSVRDGASEDERAGQRTATELIEQLDAKDEELQRLTELLEKQEVTLQQQHEQRIKEMESAHEEELSFLMGKLDELEAASEAVSSLESTRTKEMEEERDSLHGEVTRLRRATIAAASPPHRRHANSSDSGDDGEADDSDEGTGDGRSRRRSPGRRHSTRGSLLVESKDGRALLNSLASEFASKTTLGGAENNPTSAAIASCLTGLLQAKPEQESDLRQQFASLVDVVKTTAAEGRQLSEELAQTRQAQVEAMEDHRMSQSKLNQAETTIEELKQQVAEAESSGTEGAAKANAIANKLREEVRSLAGTANALSSDLKDEEVKCRNFKTKCERLAKQVEELTSQSEAAKEEIEKAQQEKGHVEIKLEVAERTTATVRKELEDLQNRNSMLQAQAERISMENSRVMVELEEAQQSAKASGANIDEIRAEVKSREERIKELEGSVEELRERLTSRDEQIAELEGACEGYSDDVAALQHKLDGLNVSNMKLKVELETAKRNAATVEAAASDDGAGEAKKADSSTEKESVEKLLQEQLEREREGSAAIRAELLAVRKQKTSLESRVHDLEAEQASLKEKIDSLKSNQEAAKAEAAAAASALAKHEADSSKAAVEHQKEANQRMTEAADREKQLQSRVAHLEEELSASAAQRKEHEEAVAALEAKVAAAEARSAEATAEATAAATAAKSQNASSGQSTVEFEKLQGALKRAEAEAEAAREEVDKLKDMLQQAEQTAAQRELKLEDAMKRNTEADRVAHNAEAAALAAKITELEEEVEEAVTQKNYALAAAEKAAQALAPSSAAGSDSEAPKLSASQTQSIHKLVGKYRRLQREKVVLVSELKRAKAAAKAANAVAARLSAAAQAARAAAAKEKENLDEATRETIAQRRTAHERTSAANHAPLRNNAFSPGNSVAVVADVAGVGNVCALLNGRHVKIPSYIDTLAVFNDLIQQYEVVSRDHYGTWVATGQVNWDVSSMTRNVFLEKGGVVVDAETPVTDVEWERRRRFSTAISSAALEPKADATTAPRIYAKCVRDPQNMRHGKLTLDHFRTFVLRNSSVKVATGGTWEQKKENWKQVRLDPRPEFRHELSSPECKFILDEWTAIQARQTAVVTWLQNLQVHDVFASGFSQGLQLRALGLRSAFKIISEIVAFAQTKTLIPLAAFIRTHQEDHDDSSDGGSHNGDKSDDEDDDDGGEMMALFDVRLGINCWEEYDLQPLCKVSKASIKSSQLTAAQTSKVVLNVLESWTADPSRIHIVHEWITKVLNAPAQRMVRKSALMLRRGRPSRIGPSHHGIELKKMKARVATDFIFRIVPHLAQALGSSSPDVLRMWMRKSPERMNNLAMIPAENQRVAFFRDMFGTAPLEDIINGDGDDQNILIDIRLRALV